jgi:hypothetical protein
MRSALLLLPLLVLGCAKSETPKTDTSAMAPAPAATLAESDIAGTWTGTAKAAGTDSVISHWTQICGGGTCRGTSQEDMKDTIPSTYTIMGDSAVGQTQPYKDPGMKGAEVVDHWTVHIASGNVTGTGHFTLASKPDSVLARYTFTGAKQP